MIILELNLNEAIENIHNMSQIEIYRAMGELGQKGGLSAKESQYRKLLRKAHASRQSERYSTFADQFDK